MKLLALPERWPIWGDILVNVGVRMICQDMILRPQDFHSFLGILFQLEPESETKYFDRISALSPQWLY